MRLEYKKGSSAKFWDPSLDGRTITVRFGRLGTDGQTRATKLASPAAAKAALAKLVAEKRAKGYAPASAKAAKPTKSVKGRTELLALATELGGAAVAKEVALAADDPERYLATTKHELFEDFEPDDDLPWLALIEALEAKRRLAEVDWKEYASEVLAWLEVIGGAAAKRALKAAHEPELDERFTYEALALFGKLLGAAGLALISLDKGSDSYPLMVVPAKDVARLTAMARKAAATIDHYTGKDLAEEEQRRHKKDKKQQTTHPWQQLVVADEFKRGTSSAVDSILFDLRHDMNGELREKIRAAMPSAPKRDQPVIAMSLSLYDQPASRIAKTTKDPELCLRALDNLREEDDPFERLAAAAILAERLPVKPDRGKRHLWVCEACNLWAKPKLVDAALAKLPRGGWARLARLVDAMLATSRPGSDGYTAAFRAINNVGDGESLPVLATVGERGAAALAASGMSYGDDDPPWTRAEKQIAARLKRLRR